MPAAVRTVLLLSFTLSVVVLAVIGVIHAMRVLDESNERAVEQEDGLDQPAAHKSKPSKTLLSSAGLNG
ncbi:hypothetical protein [Novosphingobium sp. PhB165]|uniref:hypothetical protein n=1 Tax=Novosphingobium sp. PhB165 TaxID=2485105 RepID=UPI0014056139|nr:hypothetical protein [Novosphingobium sp. PhB165]